jgi:hypothetical protein
MRRWEEQGVANPRVTALIERFHLTHVLNYEHLDWADVSDVDAKLADVGVHLCLVTASPDELRRRIRAERAGAWGSFLTEPGQRHHFQTQPSDEAKADYFVAQQEALLTLAERSRMPKSHVDTTATSPDLAAKVPLGVLLGGSDCRQPPNQALQSDERGTPIRCADETENSP